jgi:hypothetical protein
MMRDSDADSMDPFASEGMPWKPPALYKYVSLDRALKILQTQEIRFTQPSHLNDPHELSVEINPQSLIRDFYDHMVGQGFTPARAADIARRNIPGMVVDQVDRVVVERDRVGILSLCDSPENMLLWAHYGDEHRGAVLEVDISDMITPREEPEEIQVLSKVIYSDERVDYIARRLPLWMTLAYKSAAWAYECEWRLFKSLSALRQKSETVFVAGLPPNAIKRVIFGARAVGPDEEAAITLIQQSAEHQHIKIEKAMFTSGLVGLDFRSGRSFAGAILHGQHHFGENWRQLRQWVDLEKMKQAELGVGLPCPGD